MKFTSQGHLEYSTCNRGMPKLILSVDENIVSYYRALLPKALSQTINKQGYPAHISIIRKERIDKRKFFRYWGKYYGQCITTNYDNVVYNDETYYWINCYSEEFLRIREELGLSPIRSWTKVFHITIGNTKCTSSSR